MEAPPTRERGASGAPFARIVSEIGSKGDLPAVPEVVHQLQTAIRKENCNSLEVARIILKDTALSSKVLRVVNSSFYRRHATPVSTVTGAIVLLGFQTIRDLSAGLLLIDHFARIGRTSRNIQEGLRHSLYCGLLSQSLSARLGYATPEEAYLLGLVANFTELWIAAHYPTEFKRALDLQDADRLSLDEALTRVLGGPPAGIAAAALAHWGFPERYLDYFRSTRPAGGRGMVTPAEKLLAIVRLSSEYIDHARAGDPSGTERVLRQFGALFAVETDTFLDAARSTHAEFREHASTAGLPAGPILDPEVFKKRQRPKKPDTDVEAVPSNTRLPTAKGSGGSIEVDPDAGTDAGSGTSGARISAQATDGHTDGAGDGPVNPGIAASALGIVADITRSILDAHDINDTLSMVLEGIGRVGGFDVAFLALLNVSRDAIVCRLGYGDGVSEQLARLSIPLGATGGILIDTVQQRTPQVAADTSPAALVPPGAPIPRIVGRCFISYPVIVHDLVLGTLVAGRTAPTPPTAADHALLRLFCDQACLALEKCAS